MLVNVKMFVAILALLCFAFGAAFMSTTLLWTCLWLALAFMILDAAQFRKG